MDQDQSQWRFFVKCADGLEVEYHSEEEAIAAARSDARTCVVCVTESGHYRTRQTIWPEVGPVYAEN